MYSLNRIVFWALMLAAVASGFVVKYNYISVSYTHLTLPTNSRV